MGKREPKLTKLQAYMYTQSQRREFMNREEVEEEEDNNYDQENGVGEEENRREEPAPLFETVPSGSSWCADSRANSRG